MVTAAVYWDLHSRLLLNLSLSSYSTGQVSDPIHHLSILQNPVFLLNSRHLLFCAAHEKKILSVDTLSPEVTESIRRVPSILFIQTSLYFL